MTRELDDILQPYRAQIDAWGIDPDMMTDAGVRVGELEPIGDCELTPGDPSPVGRTSEGDLAYVIRPDYEHVRVTRDEAALIADALDIISPDSDDDDTLGEDAIQMRDRLEALFREIAGRAA